VSRSAERLLRTALFLFLCVHASFLRAAATSEKHHYHIDAGDASVTLQQYVSQSREDVIYLLPKVRGIRTNEVVGDHTAEDAIEKMLAGTGLLHVKDQETGALMITRAEVGQDATNRTSSTSRTDRSNSDQTMKSRSLIALLGSWIGLLGPAHVARPAQNDVSLSPASSERGMISGRVFNPVTGEYIRNAEIKIEGTPLVAISEDGGYYRLTNVPVGEVRLTATYTGHDPVRTTVAVAAAATVTKDFELSSTGSGPSDDRVRLEAFVVTTERAGQAKAIAEQKNSMNIKTVVASDNFGDVFEGNVGEFLKFMPGITLDYVETDTRSARIGGLEAQYGSVTLDGGTMASTNSLAGSFRDSARAFEFEAVSINNIESIEVYKTLSADMPGDAPAGTINLRTKSALDRKGRRFSYTVAMVGNEYELTLNRTARPDDARHAKIRPMVAFDYSNAFFDNKLGVAINGSFTNAFKEQFRVTHTYDYTSAQAIAAGMPLVSAITFKDGPKITEKNTAGLKLDYQPFTPLRLSLTSSYTLFADEMSNRTMEFRGVGNLGPGSSITKLVALPSGNNANTRVRHAGKYSLKRSDTTNFSLGFTYKQSRLTVDGLASYSRARFRNGAEQHQTVDSAFTEITRIGFIAERSSPDATDWNFTQTHGADWSNLENWGRNDPFANNIDAQHSVAKTEQFVGQINARYSLGWELPTFLKTGLYRQVTTRMRHYNKMLYTKTYVGPAGNQLNAIFPVSSAEVRIAQAWGGNLWSLPAPDRKAVWDLLQEHPEYFAANAARQGSDLEEMLGNPQSNQEQIDAAYVMQNTRLGRWQLQGGVRYERTRTRTGVKAEVPVNENPFANVTTNPNTGVRTYSAVNNPDYVTYKWSRPPVKSWGEYDSFLPSASAKYTIRDNLFLKLGYNKSISRPRLDYIAGRWIVDTGDNLVTIPNPGLTPERAQKFSAMLEYYFSRLGTIGIHVFRTEIEGANDRIGPLDAAEVGLADDPVFGTYEFMTFRNVPGTRVIKGIELNYSQQLTFLPVEVLRGLSVFATYSRFASHDRPANFMPQNATGGLSWRYRRFSAGIAGTWNDEFRTGAQIVTANSPYFPTEPEYVKERLLFDVNTAYEISPRLSVFVSGRNAFNEGRVWYYKGSSRVRQHEKFGGHWSLGVKGTF
jgi:iron complex outermembrane recepter protein